MDPDPRRANETFDEWVRRLAGWPPPEPPEPAACCAPASCPPLQTFVAGVIIDRD